MNTKPISFKKTYTGTCEDIFFDLGTDLNSIGNIFKMLAKKKEEE